MTPLSCYIFGTAPNGEETLARVPLGTKLSQLDELAVGGWDSISKVAEYSAAKGDEKPTKTPFGEYVVTDLGEFKDWQASDAERDGFTGVVTLLYFSAVIPDDLNPSFAINYFYVEGVLKQKEYSQLPG